ncbi:hypothetical protein SKAU_G00272660 [Synaphobranchus kaupii]|uniref:Uncharacterized protein n=1 Tax=Synaphobranchus kaupii TaxID=118154 RepID=A0A9Q1IQJ5_SYNKA|nr:hypothetical protein SKAU_G00272660 [Synaphobranchus kaupii]
MVITGLSGDVTGSPDAISRGGNERLVDKHLSASHHSAPLTTRNIMQMRAACARAAGGLSQIKFRALLA